MLAKVAGPVDVADGKNDIRDVGITLFFADFTLLPKVNVALGQYCNIAPNQYCNIALGQYWKIDLGQYCNIALGQYCPKSILH